MYAIIATGGKQYSVQPGDTLRVEKLDAQSGDTVKFDVLFINDEGSILTGKDVVSAYAEAEVLGEGKGEKIVVYKYKAKKNIRRKQGHRQPFTAVKILNIVK
ncbi:MAG: 50S ribosomal protein L21 [Clostridia bacterium]|nr:50S ribosomal protein L21 [Clostridia bacterium]